MPLYQQINGSLKILKTSVNSFEGGGGGGGGGGVVFAVEQEMKIFSTIFRDFGKNMVVKRYLQHSALPVITGKNNEKSGSEIMKTIFRYLNIF